MQRRRRTGCLAVSSTSSSSASLLLHLLLYTSATKAHSLLIKSSVKGRPGPWQAHCESGGRGGGCVCASRVGKRREINAALKGADKTPVPQRWREEGACCKTVGRPFPFLYKEGRGKKRQHRELGCRKLWLGIFEFQRVWSWFYTLIPGS